jgi:hypothetical protein
MPEVKSLHAINGNCPGQTFARRPDQHTHLRYSIHYLAMKYVAPCANCENALH